MPDRATHKKFSKLLLGDDCNATHAAIDYPFRFLGRKHRVLFHDPLSAVLIGYFMDDYKGVASAVLHLAADEYLKPRRAKPLMKVLNYVEKLVRNYKPRK